MGAGWEIGSAIAGAIGGLFNTGYTVYQDQRNYNYMRNLQNQQFAREDSAIKRRVNDAVASGINPYDAIGSGSGAGSSMGSVGSHNVEGLNVGSMFDARMKIEKLKQEKELTKQAKQQTRIISNERKNSDVEQRFRQIENEMQTGERYSWYHDSDNLPFMTRIDPYNVDSYLSLPMVKKYMSEVGVAQFLKDIQENKVDISELQKELTGKQNDWYTFDKVFSTIMSILGFGVNAGNMVLKATN